jgi:CRISPR/Cas system CMR subunit Cmr6 (Cas7 group RAMP superfamily)
VAEVAGPLGRAVKVVDRQGLGLGNANARLVLDRVAGLGDDDRKAVDSAKRRWLQHRLSDGDAALRKALLRRRRAAVARLGRQGRPSAEVRLTVTRWSPLAIGHSGAGTANDNSLALHTVSGDPVLPASALKGVARALGGDGHDRLFGHPGGGDGGGALGAVTFLAGLPTGKLGVRPAVLTPHAQPYYADPENNPPSGHYPPVPVEFLAVRDGAFVAHVIGRDDSDDARRDVAAAARLLADAADEIGVGAKTSAGFGYLRGVVQ